jgi:capsule polysaccharide export protein KpsC/LpsZ
MANKESLDTLARAWAIEAKNIILLSGAELGIDSALDFAKRVSKYLMKTDARVTAPTDDARYIVIRHDAGEKFSYFIGQAFDHLFQIMRIRAIIDYDTTTVFIKIEKQQ